MHAKHMLVHPFPVAEQSICACGKHALALQISKQGTSVAIIALPQAEICFHYQLGTVEHAQWAPVSCIAAVTVYQPWLADDSYSDVSLHMLSATEGIVGHTLVTDMGQCVRGFIWSPDELLLAALIQYTDGIALSIFNAATCTEIARYEEVNSLVYEICHLFSEEVGAPHFVWDPMSSTSEASGCTDPHLTRGLRLQWLPCSTRVALWLKSGSSWQLHASQTEQDPYVHTKTCEAVTFVLVDGDLHHQARLPVADQGPIDRPAWGMGGFAALDASRRAVVLAPLQAVRSPTAVLQPQLEVPSHSADLQVLHISCPEIQDYRPSDTYRDTVAYAWAPNTCFLAVASCKMHHEGHAVLLRVKDGRTGAIAVERDVVWEFGRVSGIAWIHAQWSLDGSAVVISLAAWPKAHRDPWTGLGHQIMNKFVMSFTGFV